MMMAKSSSIRNLSVAKAKASPSETFNSPGDVLRAPLSHAQKLDILKSWEDEAHQLQAAEGENMGGGERSHLDDIRRAIDALLKNDAGEVS
jgi:hypothetical protein